MMSVATVLPMEGGETPSPGRGRRVGSTSTYSRQSVSTIGSTAGRSSTSTNGRGSVSTTGRGSTSRPPNDVDLVYIQSLTNHQIDKWKSLFETVDRTGGGEMTVEDFERVLQDPEFYPDLDRHTAEVLMMKCLEPNRQFISYQEFINIMSNKRNPSFRLAIETQGKEHFLLTSQYPSNTTFFRGMVRYVAEQYLTDELDRQYYADKYSCCPPPLFIPFITMAEVGFFVYHCLEANNISPTGPVPVESVFIYRPDRRLQLWRFIFYMFIHAGWVHLFFNMLVQIIVGIPLEMVHGSFRIALVYLAGVLAGSLGTSVFDIKVYLVGASGGVYALLAAHLANVMLNYTHMEFGILKLAAVLIVASADVGFAIWDRYSSLDKAPPVGYTAHLMGALAGLTMGLVVLKNFEQKLHEQYLWWISLSIYLVCFAFAIFWNVFYY
ncbi:rhomboid-related protein 3-like [Pecten maximus]|uniref:rhomboid-related protein 3-like n=1 Tax=Pecten maximus TaxID=6579 RepID=UPI0014589B54|nr:rhomboid-related protein 3-like [Pecten maximus]